MPAARSGGWQRQIQPFGIQARVEGGFVEMPLLPFQGGFELLFGGIEQLANAFAIFGRKLAYVFADQGERALTAQGLHADGLQFVRGTRGSDARQGTGYQFLYGFIEHWCGVFYCSKGGLPRRVPVRYAQKWPPQRDVTP